MSRFSITYIFLPLVSCLLSAYSPTSAHEAVGTPNTSFSSPFGRSLTSLSFDNRRDEGNVNGRFISSLSRYPFAFGTDVSKNGDVERLASGLALSAGSALQFSFIGQMSKESSREAVGIASSIDLDTYATSSRLSYRLLVGHPNDLSVYTYVDTWHAPGGDVLFSSLVSNLEFGGASGYRIAPGASFDIADVHFSLAAGHENATQNGDDGFFGKADAKLTLEDLSLGFSGWTSPNFGNGVRLNLGHVFGNGMQVSAYGGYDFSPRSSSILGVSVSIPIGEATGNGNEVLVGGLNEHFEYMQQTLYGMPTSARTKALKNTSVAPPPFPFADINGNMCSFLEATPGCTFDTTTGIRITVSSDPDFNKNGGGLNDLWTVTFDAGGNGAIYDASGNFQYSASVSAFAGYISGTTVGAGTSSLSVENVANGAYWLGKNGVLYSADPAAANYSQAVN